MKRPNKSKKTNGAKVVKWPITKPVIITDEEKCKRKAQAIINEFKSVINNIHLVVDSGRIFKPENFKFVLQGKFVTLSEKTLLEIHTLTDKAYITLGEQPDSIEDDYLFIINLLQASKIATTKRREESRILQRQEDDLRPRLSLENQRQKWGWETEKATKEEAKKLEAEAKAERLALAWQEERLITQERENEATPYATDEEDSSKQDVTESLKKRLKDPFHVADDGTKANRTYRRA